MQEEGYKYEEGDDGYLESVIAQKFIVYPSENDQSVHNQLKRLSSYIIWEFENVEGEAGYKIAYN